MASKDDEDLNRDLYRHCRMGEVAQVKYLLDLNIEGQVTWTNKRDRNRSLLMATAWKDSHEVCALLIQKSAPVNHQDASKMTALHVCAKQNSIRVAELLLQCPDIDPNIKAENGITPLMISADLGHTDIGRLLIAHRDIQLDLQSDRGFTALMKAVFENSEDLAILLIEKGARLDLDSQGGFTALHLCAQVNRRLLAEKILTRVQDPGRRAELINRTTKPEFKGNTAFILAALNGHTEVLKLLMQHKADIHLRNSEGASALDQVRRQDSAASREALQLLEEWYQSQVPSQPQSAGPGDLFEAIKSDKGAVVVRQLIDKGVQTDMADPNTGHTPLMLAAALGKREILQQLLDGRAGARMTSTAINWQSDRCGKATALHVAVKGGYESCVELLLQYDASPGVQDDCGLNLLHLCAELNSSAQMMKLLLAKARPSDIQAKDKSQRTPAEVAAVKGSLDALKALLLDRDQDIGVLTSIRKLAEDSKQFRVADLVQSYIPGRKDEDALKISQLFLAALERNAGAVSKLLASGSRKYINEKYQREPKWTALMAAAWNDDLDICELLLKHGADPNVQDERLSITALHIAVQQNSVKVAKKLLDLPNIALNVRSKDERTPLIRAAWLNCLAIGKLLLDKNAMVNEQEQDGFSALHFCAQENLQEFAMLLINHGADLELKTGDHKNRNTAFTLAAIKGHADMMELLANAGADICYKSKKGNALDLVRKQKHDKAEALLQRLGAERICAPSVAGVSSASSPGSKVSATSSASQAKSTCTAVKADAPQRTQECQIPQVDSTADCLNLSSVRIIGQEYMMRSNPRGICVIVNNDRFSCPTRLPDRTGSKNDVQQLTRLFRDTLKFRVQVHSNLDAIDIRALMQSLASGNRHTTYDCFVSFIMSHGERDVVFGSDGEPVLLKDIFDMFGDCDSLRDKPKLFFLQACRRPPSAENVDAAVAVPPVAGPLVGPADLLTDTKLDFLYAFATTEGDYAFRDPETGSVYVKKLCEVFTQQYREKHVCTMLNHVRLELSRRSYPIQITTDGPPCIAYNIPSETTQLRAEVWFRDVAEHSNA